MPLDTTRSGVADVHICGSDELVASEAQPLDAVPQLVRHIGHFAFHVQHRSMLNRQTTAAANSLDLPLNRSRRRDDGDAVRRRALRRAQRTELPALPGGPRDGPARLHLLEPDERVDRGAWRPPQSPRRPPPGAHNPAICRDAAVRRCAPLDVVLFKNTPWRARRCVRPLIVRRRI
ncbi:MAG: hypothetical protein QOJ99_4042 [Bryobacterales bacterium]|nr:hypothetical protein [Bryobacterales bacterium]